MSPERRPGRRVVPHRIREERETWQTRWKGDKGGAIRGVEAGARVWLRYDRGRTLAEFRAQLTIGVPTDEERGHSLTLPIQESLHQTIGTVYKPHVPCAPIHPLTSRECPCHEAPLTSALDSLCLQPFSSA